MGGQSPGGGTSTPGGGPREKIVYDGSAEPASSRRTSITSVPSFASLQALAASFRQGMSSMRKGKGGGDGAALPNGSPVGGGVHETTSDAEFDDRIDRSSHYPAPIPRSSESSPKRTSRHSSGRGSPSGGVGGTSRVGKKSGDRRRDRPPAAGHAWPRSDGYAADDQEGSLTFGSSSDLADGAKTSIDNNSSSVR